MPLYQNTSVDSDKLIIGNYKIEVATVGSSVASTWDNLGAGMISAFGHNITKYNVQAGNAPDPMEGIATETFTISGELIEYDGEMLATAYGGILTVGSTATSASIIYGGGEATVTPKSFKLTNTRMVAGATEQTVILVYKGTFDNGLQFTIKSDNDQDPISVMSFSITGKLDSTRTAGDQLYSIRKWID